MSKSTFTATINSWTFPDAWATQYTKTTQSNLKGSIHKPHGRNRRMGFQEMVKNDQKMSKNGQKRKQIMVEKCQMWSNIVISGGL